LEEEREFLMNLSPAYLKWEEETINQAKKEGRNAMAKRLLQMGIALQQVVTKW
jgi:hypothetical protein